MFDEFRHRVHVRYLEVGSLCFRVGADKDPFNLLRRVNDPRGGTYPWVEFVNHSGNGWSFDDVYTDHPVYASFITWEGKNYDPAITVLVSEEVK